MKDFDDLLSVWQGQPKQVKLSVDDVLKQVKKGVNKLKAKLIWGLGSVALSLVVVVLVVLFTPIHNNLTYAGLGAWIVMFVVVLVMLTGDYKTISSLDATVDPATYISHLKVYRKRRAIMNGKFFYYYALAISLGILLYTNEFAYMIPMGYKIAFYVFWVLYIAFVLLYLKNKLIERENKRVAEMLEELERLQLQFE